MELTPLRRASSGAVLGGVCAGLARRWQVDPTVLRIAMVLLGLLGGVGIALYVGAVLLVPREGNTDFPLYRVAPFTRSWPPAAAIGAVVCLGVLIMALVGSWLPFGIVPVVGLGFLWYFGFYRRQRSPQRGADEHAALGPGAAQPGPGAPTPGQPQTDFEKAAAAWRERMAQEQQNRTPPAAGAAPSAPINPTGHPESLYEPTPFHNGPLNDPYRTQRLVEYRPTPPPPPAVPDWTPPVPRGDRRRRPRWVWPLVLVLTGTGLAVLTVLSAVFGVAVPPLAYAGAVVGTLGVGLLISAFAGRRARGLLPLALLAALVTVVMTLPAGQVGGPVGDRIYSYTAMAQLPTGGVDHGAGDVTLDLTGLTIDQTRSFEFSQGVGEATVRLPATGNVVVQWSVGLGEFTGPDGRHEGADVSGEYGRITDASAPTLTLVLHAGVGKLVVTP
ncbi:PspC domain-containing protein [Micropruina sonneratiae]|uniref:PspC domain-containing protein n=1 Tax=Micropruina sonneratiae TaxID=2986940 RepID=UPI002227A8BD|nr:PspC domain-containing protein [Micropruina sp. KQZ13P-5]MCW3156990.1 PspC domain-containing protein [Micropruina sp. KQZ13P-5]